MIVDTDHYLDRNGKLREVRVDVFPCPQHRIWRWFIEVTYDDHEGNPCIDMGDIETITFRRALLKAYELMSDKAYELMQSEKR